MHVLLHVLLLLSILQVVLVRMLMQLLLKVLLRLLEHLLEMLGLALHLHLELLHVVVINGDGLMGHRLLSHLVQRLAPMVIHGVLMHLQCATNVRKPQHVSTALTR